MSISGGTAPVAWGHGHGWDGTAESRLEESKAYCNSQGSADTVRNPN